MTYPTARLTRPRTLGLSLLLVAACARGGSGDTDASDEPTAPPLSSTGSGEGTFDAASSTGTGAGGTAETSTTSGAGGSSTSTTGVSQATAASSTASATTASTSASSTGSGGASPSCDHDVCTPGGPLLKSCDECSAAVCAADPFCCMTSWDPLCVGATGTLCANDPCGTLGSSSASSSSSTGGGGNTVLPGDLLITEIMNDPAKVEDTKGEWFEVYNASPSPLDLKGLVLRHQAIAVDPNAAEAIVTSVVVPAGGYVVLGNNGDLATNGGVTIHYVYSSKVSLNNSKDYVALETADATLLDGVTYDTAKLKVTGKSRSLDPASMTMLGNDTDTNFCAAKTLIAGSTDYGTPGKTNDSCK
jgi:hypothetical protein